MWLTFGNTIAREIFFPCVNKKQKNTAKPLADGSNFLNYSTKFNLSDCKHL